MSGQGLGQGWNRRWGSAGRLMALGMLAFAPLTLAPARGGAESHVDGELILEQRLVAPCCWVQTLDIHDSPIAKELRAEIHARLVRGERPSAIEADLVGRYGTRLVAMPASNPLAKAALFLGAVLLLVGVAVIRAVRRWKRAGAADAAAAADDASGLVAPLPVAGPAGGPAATSSLAAHVRRDEWDERLDDELHRAEP